MKLRLLVKRCVQALALILASPLALASGFGKSGPLFELFAQSLSLVPGFPGNFLRAAYYRLTLADCSIDTVIGFGSFFSRPQAVIARNVSIGSYCIIGPVDIGTRTQISSHVEIPAKALHSRDANGRLSGSLDNPDARVRIGADCWIGASVVVMADVGEQATIGAGSVVVKNIPACTVAVGSPARVIKSSVDAEVAKAAL